MWLSWDIDKIRNMDRNVANVMPLALAKIWLTVQNAAKENAPYLTWTLRRSISTDFDKITQWVVIVWSPVVYARRREYENYLHPERKFYLKRAYTENKKEILDIVRKYLSDWLD